MLVIIVQDFYMHNNSNNSDEVISSITIAAGLGGGIAIAGNLSGAGLNPALAFGFNFARYLSYLDSGALRFIWIYILGPFLGAVLAWVIFWNLYFKDGEFNAIERYDEDEDIEIDAIEEKRPQSEGSEKRALI